MSAVAPAYRGTARPPKVLIKWSSTQSLFDHARNAGSHNKRSFPALSADLPTCTCSRTICKTQPRIRGQDGILHVSSRQSEIDWSKFTSDLMLQDACTHASIKTRIIPDAVAIMNAFTKGLEKVISATISPFLPPTQVAQHLLIPSEALLSEDLALIAQTCTAALADTDCDVQMNLRVANL